MKQLVKLTLVLSLLSTPALASNTLEHVRHCLSLKDLADDAYKLREQWKPVTILHTHTVEQAKILVEVSRVALGDRKGFRRKVFMDCLDRYGVTNVHTH